MTLHRTAAGLTNQRLFYRKDVTVYIEGGPEESPENHSLDVLFWEGLFELLGGSLTYHFKSAGSKTALLPIAERIRQDGVTNTLVAMDRDYDPYRGISMDIPAVMYTYGYSWENDVWSRSVVEDLFFSNCTVSRRADIAGRIREEIDGSFEHLERCLRWPIYADYLSQCEACSCLPSDKPESIVVLDTDGRPRVNRQRVRSLVHAAAKAPLRRKAKGRVTWKVDVARDCRGHILEAYAYRLVIYLMRQHSKAPKLPKHFASTMAIRAFREFLHEKQDNVRCHYEAQFERALQVLNAGRSRRRKPATKSSRLSGRG